MPRSTAGREIQVLVLLKQTDINKPRGLGNNQQPETSNKSDDLQTNMECKWNLWSGNVACESCDFISWHGGWLGIVGRIVCLSMCCMGTDTDMTLKCKLFHSLMGQNVYRS